MRPFLLTQNYRNKIEAKNKKYVNRKGDVSMLDELIDYIRKIFKFQCIKMKKSEKK